MPRQNSKLHGVAVSINKLINARYEMYVNSHSNRVEEFKELYSVVNSLKQSNLKYLENEQANKISVWTIRAEAQVEVLDIVLSEIDRHAGLIPTAKAVRDKQLKLKF